MAYRMTAARRAALRKAQLASARKRRGRKLSKKKIAVGVLGVSTAYLVGREIKGTNTYMKNREKVKNITVKKRVGYKTVINKQEQSFNRYANSYMGRSPDDPPEYTGSIFRIPLYRRQFRTRQSRKHVFSTLDRFYQDRSRTTFKSRHKTRQVRRKAKRRGY